MAKANRHSAELVLHDRQGSVFLVQSRRGTKKSVRGYFEVRDGSLIWYPKYGQRGWRISWQDLEREDAPRWRGSYRTFDARRYLSRSR